MIDPLPGAKTHKKADFLKAGRWNLQVWRVIWFTTPPPHPPACLGGWRWPTSHGNGRRCAEQSSEAETPGRPLRSHCTWIKQLKERKSELGLRCPRSPTVDMKTNREMSGEQMCWHYIKSLLKINLSGLDACSFQVVFEFSGFFFLFPFSKEINTSTDSSPQSVACLWN